MTFKPNLGDIYLGKYEVVSLVGEGAFGVVYRARDIKLDRIVAIKFLHANGEVLERFADELDAIKTLDHPNIVRLYDYDILKETPCFVMEFVNGREIGDILCDEGTFDMLRICEITLQVLDALVETHKHGIVHCDLKPENIMLTSVGARSEVVKLIDFGVASILSKTSDDRQKTLVGTPQYMAPEQIRHLEIGPWTDIYAVGLIMIELYTGQFVFEHDDPREVLRMQLYSPVEMPTTLAKSVLGPIIRHAVEKDPEDRYRSTQQFYEDVREAMQILQTEAREKRDQKHEISRGRAVSSLFSLDDISDPPDDVVASLNAISNSPIQLAFKRGNGDSSRPVVRKDSSLHASQVPLLDGSRAEKTQNTPSEKTSTTPSRSDVNDSQTENELGVGLDLSSLQSSIGDLAESQESLKDHGHWIPESEKKNEGTSPRETTSSPSLSLCEGSEDSPMPVIQKTMGVVESDLSESGVRPSKTVYPPVKPKKSRFVVWALICFLALAAFVGGYYAWHNGVLEQTLEQYGISTPEALKQDEDLDMPKDAVVAADSRIKKNVVRFTTIRDAAITMAYVAAFSGMAGRSTTIQKFKTYRVIGTPMDAKIYVEDALVCDKTPCNVNVYGNPALTTLEIRYQNERGFVSLDHHDPKLPVILTLKK